RETWLTSQLRGGHPGRPREDLGGSGSRKFCLVTACRACRGGFEPTLQLAVWPPNFVPIMNTKCNAVPPSGGRPNRSHAVDDLWRSTTNARAALATAQEARQATGTATSVVPPLWTPPWAAEIVVDQDLLPRITINYSL